MRSYDDQSHDLHPHHDTQTPSRSLTVAINWHAAAVARWARDRSVPTAGALVTLGVRDDRLCERVPQTCRVLQQLRKWARPRRSALILARYSVLQGAAHIWPHCGPSNARLRLHLPLAVPEGDYRLVVGEQARPWVMGTPLLFDDSFRHEVFAQPRAGAGVRGEGGAARRVVLIVDVWHPDIAERDRPALLERLRERQDSADEFVPQQQL
eukprot:COSAG01_NODE_6429_length_3670_cov_6.618594_4_plen_210_part_00